MSVDRTLKRHKNPGCCKFLCSSELRSSDRGAKGGLQAKTVSDESVIYSIILFDSKASQRLSVLFGKNLTGTFQVP